MKLRITVGSLLLLATQAFAQAPTVTLSGPVQSGNSSLPRISPSALAQQLNTALAALYNSSVQKNALAAAIGGTDLSAGMVTPTAGSPESMAVLAATVQSLNFQSQGAVERINPAILAPLLIPSDTNGFNGVARSPGAIVADHDDIFSHGAICDGSSHVLSTLGLTLPQLVQVYGSQVTSISQTIEADAMAVQGAINEARTHGSPAQNMGAGFIDAQTAIITAGGARGVCMLGGTRIDMTNIKSSSFKFEGGGTQFFSNVVGDAAWDMTGDVGVVVDNLNIVGSFSNFTASIAPTSGASTGTMIVTAVNKGTIPFNVPLSTNQATSIAAGTVALSEVPGGTPGGAGTYIVSVSQTVPSENIVSLGSNECILMGRTSAQFGSTANVLNRPVCSGSFVYAPMLANSAESTTINQPYFENFAPNGNGIDADGTTHLAQCSTVTGVACPPTNMLQSFNQFIVNQPQIFVHGINASCIWDSQSHGHQYNGGYCHNDGPGNTAVVTKYFGQGSQSNEDVFTIHGETNSLVNYMVITGAANPRLFGLTVADFNPFQSGAFFASTSEVTKVNMSGERISLDQLSGTGTPTWFDNPALYYPTGYLATQDGSGFAIPTTFSGQACQPGTGSNPATCLPYQNGQPLSASSGSTALTAVPPKTTGNWYGSNDPGTEMQRANCTISVPGQVAYYPMWNGSTAWKTTRAGMNVTTAAGTGGALRIGLYTDNGNGAPGTLVQDFGEIATTTNGAPSSAAVTSFTIPHGLSWIAEQVDAVGATPAQSWGETCKSGSNAPIACFAQQVMGSNSPAASTGFGNYGLVSTSINTGAFPTTDPGTLSATATACIPAVSFFLSGFTP